MHAYVHASFMHTYRQMGACFLCPLFYGLAPPYFITQSSYPLFLLCRIFFSFSFFPRSFPSSSLILQKIKVLLLLLLLLLLQKNNYNNLLIKSTKLVYQIEKFNSLRPAMSCIFPFIFTCLPINLPCPFHSNNNNNNN